MKKALTAALALALALGLAACGRGTDPDGYETKDVQAMADAGAFSEELEELDADTAFALYRLAGCGLSQEELTDCAVRRSAGATCEEGAVLIFGSEDAARTAKGALEDYVQNQIRENEDYRPAEIPKLENAWIDRQGATVLLVIANDLEAARKAAQ